MAALARQLENLIAPIVRSMDFEFVGLEYLSMGKGALLRIYIDHPQGINVDHCAEVSYQISAMLDVEDPIDCEYTLEVSSPGIDRPLFTPAHYQRFIGEQARIVLHHPAPGSNRKKFKGVIQAVDEQDPNNIQIEVAVDGETFSLPWKLIKKARLIAQI